MSKKILLKARNLCKTYSSGSEHFHAIKNGVLSTSLNISMDVIDGSYNDLGYKAIKGRNPEGQNEIALAALI